MPPQPDHPFVPKTTATLQPGQFWAIRLSDGRFACGRVVGLREPGVKGARTQFVAGLMDWVGDEPPAADSIAGAPLLEHGHAHVKSIPTVDGGILGARPLHLDGVKLPGETRTWYTDSGLQRRAEFVFVKGSPPPRSERRTVCSPLTDEMLRPFTSAAGVVQFSTPLTDGDHQRLAELLASEPNVGLRAYESITDLDFLRFFPTLTDFSVDSYRSLTSLDGLRHLPTSLRSLAIGPTKRRLDLDVLARFTELTSLGIEGQTKNIAVVGKLVSLEELMLRSVTLDDLAILLPLQGLRSLDVKLGGTSDLRLLPQIGRLEHVELWMIRGLDDLGPIGELPHLRYLFLQTLRQVTALPDFSGTPALKRLHIETMKGLRDLSPINRATALEDLLLTDMRHLAVDDLACLVDHPSLSAVTVGLGSRKKNDAAKDLLGRLPVDGYKIPWRDV